MAIKKLKPNIDLTSVDGINSNISVKKSDPKHQRAVTYLQDYVKSIINKDPENIVRLLTARLLLLEQASLIAMDHNEIGLFETAIEEISLINDLIE